MEGSSHKDLVEMCSELEWTELSEKAVQWSAIFCQYICETLGYYNIRKCGNTQAT